MKLRNRIFAIMVAAATVLGLGIGSASAQDNGEMSSAKDDQAASGGGGVTLDTEALTARYVDRPLVDPKMSLRIFAGPNDHRTWTLSLYRGLKDYGIGFERYALDNQTVQGFQAGNFSNAVATFRTGAAFVPVENLEVGIGFPFAGDGRGVDDIPVWATYQFFGNDTVEIGGRFAMFLPAQTEFGMQFGIPVAIHLGDSMKIDTGMFFSMAFFDDIYTRLNIPARLTYQITDEIFVGGVVGFDLPDFDSFNMIFGFHGGYTLAIDEAIIDFGLSFTWPGFIITEDTGTVGVAHADDTPLDGNDFDMQFGANMSIKF
jgi:hypothetical protein